MEMVECRSLEKTFEPKRGNTAIQLMYKNRIS